jgi:hypothetical protein
MGKTPDDAIELASGRPLQQDGAQLAPDGLRIGSLGRESPRSIGVSITERWIGTNSTQLISFALPMLERLESARRAASLALVCCNAIWCWPIQSHSIYLPRE